MNKQTEAITAGYDSKSGVGAVAVPLYITTAFDFGTSQTAAARFALQEVGQIYSRLTNPTVDIFESKMAVLENGAASIAVSSGQAAIFSAIANLAQCGDNIIVSSKVYGGTISLTTHTLKRFGIEARIFDSDSADDLENLIDDKTKAIVFETLSNPQIAIANVDKIAKISQKTGVVSICDNTVATSVLYNPLDKDIDVVVHSASKYISGQGLSIAGVVISSKNLNKKLVKNPRYPHFNEPDESYHGLIYANLVENFDIFTLRIRLSILRDFGVTLSAFSAWQLIQGLETLDIRVRRQSENALKIAQFLEKHPKVKNVNYPGLKSHQGYKFISENFTDGLCSGLLSFEVDSFETAQKAINSTKIFKIVVNIGDSKSIITHPASTTHQQLSQNELKQAGISKELIRLSIGLENVDDLIQDLDVALK